MMNVFVAAAWIAFIVNCKAAEGSRDLSLGRDCADKNSWCESMKQFCEDQPDVMREKCPMTCNTCDSTDTVKPTFKPIEGCESLICEHTCEITAEGARCACKDGYRLGEDSKSCKDINECAFQNPCKNGRKCVNVEGSYECEEDCGQNEQKYYGRSGCCKITSGDCGKNLVNGGFAAKGKSAIVTRWPWMVLITVKTTNKDCGGILVGESWVLAAAHCLNKAKPQDVQMNFGIMNTNKVVGVKRYAQRRQAHRIVIHPKYKDPSHDVALVKTKSKLDITDYVNIACLPRMEHPPTGQKCFATGYAAIPRQGIVERRLQQEKVTIADRKTCSFLQKKKGLAESAMCVAHEKPESPADCQGSTGGPLVCQRCSSCDWYVSGLASEGISCSVDKTYSAFTSVSSYEGWIQRTMGVLENRATFGAVCQKPGKGVKETIKWSDWGAWGECSVSCGNGTTIRQRSCSNGKTDQGTCLGDKNEKKECQNDLCRVSGWAKWGKWSACTSPCGGGTKTRTRKCESAARRGCIGSSKYSETCNTQPCPKWGRWTKWGPCSVTCGRGRQTSTRICQNGNLGDNGCKGKHNKRKACRKPTCPKWTQWNEWNECSKTCGDGVRESTRWCLRGKRVVEGCEGAASKIKLCNLKECKGCPEWSTWSPCSASCGAGTRERNRKCALKTPNAATQETESCESKKCPAFWAEWSDWLDCTATCGGGVTSRSRTCTNGQPKDCRGVDTASKECNTDECQTWSDWGSWEPCNAKCGEGIRKRTRNCLTNICRGRPFDEQKCFEKECPKKEVCAEYLDNHESCLLSVAWCLVQPQVLWGICDKTCCLERYRLAFTQWSRWSTCSVTCGTGEQTRRRECSTPSYCVEFNENLEERRQCKAAPCSARIFELCSVSCGGGITQRQCMRGECADGKKFVLDTCNTKPCSETLSPWNEWGPCSQTCGVGSRDRTRQCFGSKASCRKKKLVDIEKCQLEECEGVWSEWDAWGLCSTSCGLGTIQRRRTCTRGKCTGADVQEEVCLTFDCPTETSTCEDEPTMRYICPLLATQYCNNQYTTYACRKTCGTC